MAAGAKHLHNNKIWQWQQVFHILRKTCGKFFAIESGKFEKTFLKIVGQSETISLCSRQGRAERGAKHLYKIKAS